MDEPTVEYKMEKKGVNNKTLFADIHTYIDEGILQNQVIWGNDIHRISFVDVVDDHMMMLFEQAKIDQWNVICDFRNNSIVEMDKGNYVFEVSYRQTNCLNTTKLTYRIKDLLISSLKDLLDLDLTPP